MRKLPRLVLLALSGAAMPLLAADMPLGSPAADGDAYAGAVARTVRTLIEYSRWQQPPNPIELCVAGPAGHADNLDAIRLNDGRAVRRRVVYAGALAGCDVLYMGRLPLGRLRELTAAVRGRGVLTIAEVDPDCRSEAMFCLVYQPRGLSFRLNIDAVSRSGLRVDPRVLRLSEGER